MQKNILLSIAFSLANFNVNNLVAQEQKLFTNESIAQLFSKNHIAFTAKGVLFEKGKIVGESALFNPASHKTLGCEIGADYFINKNKKSSIVTGVHIGFAPRAFTYLVTKDLLPPPLTQDIAVNGAGSNLFPLFYLSLPLSFEKRIFKDNHFFYYSGGINLKYALMFSEDEMGAYFGSPVFVKIFELRENWKNNNNFFVQANATLGYGFILKNKNLFKVGLSSNIALSNVSTANYTFTPPTGTNQDGLYVTKAGFIGLSFSYVLTNFIKK